MAMAARSAWLPAAKLASAPAAKLAAAPAGSPAPRRHLRLVACPVQRAEVRLMVLLFAPAVALLSRPNLPVLTVIHLVVSLAAPLVVPLEALQV